MKTSSEVGEIIRKAKLQGWREEPTGKGNIKLLAPDGKGVVVTGTHCTGHAFKNFVAYMRRAGFKDHVEPPKRPDRVVESVRSIVEPEPAAPPPPPVVYPKATECVEDFVAGLKGAEIFEIDTAFAACRLRNPHVTRESVAQSVLTLVSKSVLTRFERGKYRVPPQAIIEKTDDASVDADCTEMSRIIGEVHERLHQIEIIMRRTQARAKIMNEFKLKFGVAL